MGLPHKGGLPPDIDDDDKYQKITLYYNRVTEQCFVTADSELSEDSIYDILASGLESMTENANKPTDKEYIN
jgi:hypothetical protein